MKINIFGVFCIFYVRFKVFNKVIFGVLRFDIVKKEEILCGDNLFFNVNRSLNLNIYNLLLVESVI